MIQQSGEGALTESNSSLSQVHTRDNYFQTGQLWALKNEPRICGQDISALQIPYSAACSVYAPKFVQNTPSLQSLNKLFWFCPQPATRQPDHQRTIKFTDQPGNLVDFNVGEL